MSALNDKVVIVTGGSSGIGRATALSFAEDGAKVLITGRRAAPLEETAADHPNIAGLVADAATPDDAKRTIAKAVDTWGRLDVLVNNAGAGAILSLADATADRIMKILAVNVLGPSLLATAAPMPDPGTGSLRQNLVCYCPAERWLEGRNARRRALAR
jgi:NAD(P)-dependent dehydrogenase (short-subunit alcohol dehydrogenase family)